jgi:transcriptional regulator with XRE-family HTH domain
MARRIRRTFPNLETFFEETGTLQSAFASRIRKSQSYISKVRNGIIEPNLTDALIISKEAGIPLESLIKRSQELSRT